MPARSNTPGQKTCPVCSTTFEVGGRGRPPRRAVYCSRHCAMVAVNKTRPHLGSHAARPKKNRDTLHNETWLRTRYIDELRSSTELASELGCSVPSVLHALRKFSIPIRSLSEARTGRASTTVWTDEMRESLAIQRRGEANPFHGKTSPHRGRNYHPDVRIAASRKARASRRGVDGTTYDHMLEVQGGTCAICRLPEWRLHPRSGVLHTLAVDHDHVTGKVRALLCNRCNIVLGHAKDDQALLRAAIAYLEAHAIS